MRSFDPNTSSGAAVFVQDTAIYDSQGLLHADIDTITGGFNSAHLDPVGYQGQTGNYTDLETQHQAAGLYTALSGPIGIYYDPSSGVGMARSAADALNTYDQLLHPFDGWTLGAYAQTAGEFGVGELKGTVNFVSGTLVSVSPALAIADYQLDGKLSNPVAAMGESEGDGADFIQVPLTIGAALVGDPEEAFAADSGAAVRAAGAESRAEVAGFTRSSRMQRGFAMIPGKRGPPNKYGNLGKPEVRQQNRAIAEILKEKGYTITGGGNLESEERLPGPGGGNLNSFRPDITATKDGRTLRVNTVSTLADGKTLTKTEARSAAGIRNHPDVKPGEHLLLVPKLRFPKK